MQICRLYEKTGKKELFAGICFTQSSAFWKYTLKTGARFAIDSALGILKEKLEKKAKSRTKMPCHVLYALRKEMIRNNRDKQQKQDFFREMPENLLPARGLNVYMPYVDSILKQ
jgi:hypothetical protein